MKDVRKIANEISLLGRKLKHLKQTLEKIQQQCHHEFIQDHHYQRCEKCLKVEALYY